MYSLERPNCEIMKFIITLTLCALLGLVAAVNGNAAVNWSKIHPRHVDSRSKWSVTKTDEEFGSGRITGGNLAEVKQFPYQAGLLLYVEGGAAWCGGTLISNRWIVTAAHCTDELTTGVDVYLGAWNRQDRSEQGQQIIFVPTRYVIVHEDWDPDRLRNDISLIKLPVPIEFNDYIQPANLPKMASTYPTYAGENAIASGWGRISDDAIGVTDKLRWIEVPIMTNSACSVWYLAQLSSENICIKTTGGISTCNGDSGGPLVLADGSQTLIGATSFGIALGCERGWPGVFTRITSYLDWIEQHTGIANK